MGKVKDQAQALAQKMRDAHRTARESESRAHAIAKEIVKLLPAIAVEDEIERNMVEYQPGRYECKSCRQPVLFTDPMRKLPPCDNCGRDAGYEGPPPRVLNTAPPVPWKFPPGLYECTRCRARVALVTGANALSPCEFCGTTEARPV